MRRVVPLARAVIFATWRAFFLNGVAALPLIPDRFRAHVLRLAGLDVGEANVSDGVWFGGHRVSIGRGAYVNRGCRFDTHDRITLGAGVNVGMDVLFVTGSHAIGGVHQRAGAKTKGPIVVGDGAWIGARVVVLPGVSIGEGCVVAAGAVVTADCEPHGLYAGVPATRRRDLGRSA